MSQSDDDSVTPEPSADVASPDSDAFDAALEDVGEGEAASGSDEERAGVVPRIQGAWRDTLGRWATDERTTKALLSRLVEFGSLSGDEARRVFGGVRDAIETNRAELDERVDASIKSALQRFRVPNPGEVEALRTRIAEIEARIRSLETDG